MDDNVKNLMNALGVLAESSLVFFRSVLNAGGDMDEACILTQMYMDTAIYGGTPAPLPGEDGEEDD